MVFVLLVPAYKFTFQNNKFREVWLITAACILVFIATSSLNETSLKGEVY